MKNKKPMKIPRRLIFDEIYKDPKRDFLLDKNSKEFSKTMSKLQKGLSYPPRRKKRK